MERIEDGKVYIFVTTAYAVGTMSEACLLDCFRPFYVTLSSTSHNHVRHTRELSTYIGNVFEDKANSYYVVWWYGKTLFKHASLDQRELLFMRGVAQ